jgi:deoxyribodipyrimidine photolyase
MVAASFLVEYLGVSWVEGARWYHDTLVDADVAINAMMWQVCHSSAFLRFSHVLARAT